MSNQQLFDDKNKITQKPTVKAPEQDKEQPPLTLKAMQTNLNNDTVTSMQQTLGNAAVQRFLAQRSGDGSAELDDDTATSINRSRGGGHALDTGIAGKAGDVMGTDFSNVNIHTDSNADNLSRSIGAKAFTTGNDIFFREGAYNPTSSDGQHLIAHELTHVVQQGASTPSVQGKMTVNDPNDQYEAEADSVADMVMSHPEDAIVQQHEEGDDIQMMEEEEELQMQEMEEEEEVQMQEMEEEEELQM